jgi:hypothetical protein
MQNMRMSRWPGLLLAMSLGCTRPTGPSGPTSTAGGRDAGADAAPALEDDPARLADRSVKLYQDIARALTDAAGDCAAAAKSLDAIANANADVLAANARVLHAHDRAKEKRLKAALDERESEIAPSAQAIVHSDTMTKCSQDPTFAKAVDRLMGEPS